ncbi:SPW repeat protein [Amycolatopsis lurida]
MTVDNTTREAVRGPARTQEGTGRAAGASEFSIGLVLLSGVYLILSPWAIQFTGTFSMAATNMITGIVLALFAAGCARSVELRALGWVIPVIGAWVIGAPWVIFRGPGLVPLEYPGMSELNTATWLSNVIVGAVVLVAGIALALQTRRRPAHR